MNLWFIGDTEPDIYERVRLEKTAKKRGHPTTWVKPAEIEIIVNRDDKKSIRLKNQTVMLPELVLTRTGAGTDYFTLAVLRQLERLDIKVINSSSSIDCVKDKLFTHQILSQHNLPVPKTMLVKFPVDVKLVEDQLKFPVVVKVLSGSFGEGVYLSKDKDSFKDLMELVSSLGGNKNIILQEFVSHRAGQDLRVFVIGGQCIGVMLRRSMDGSFKANISRGGIGEPYELNSDVKYLALETAKILGLDIAGIDLLFDESGYKICEANSNPGFKGLEAALNINVAKKIIKYAELRNGAK